MAVFIEMVFESISKIDSPYKLAAFVVAVSAVTFMAYLARPQ